MKRTRTIAFLSALGLLLPIAGVAQDTSGCTYNRRIYPEGTEVCRDGAMQRCTAGSWGDIGLCDHEPVPEEPIAEGGDVELEGPPRSR